MDAADVEGLVIETYERADLDPSEIYSAKRVLRAVLGPGVITRIDFVSSEPAILAWVNGQPRIAVRRSLPEAYQWFYVLHEVGHVVLKRSGYVGDDEERLCDLFAAAAMAPQPALRRLFRSHGYDLELLAAEANSTESWAAMRIAEVMGIPTVLITKQQVRVRGGEWEWGDEAHIRALAKEAERPGLTKARLVDDPSRIVLTADEIDEIPKSG